MLKIRKDSDIISLINIPNILLTEIKNNNKTRLLISLVCLYYYNLINLQFNLGFMTSYQLYYIFSANKTGEHSWGMLKSKYIHIHHWLYCSFFLCILFITEYNSFLAGIFSGGIAHGIQYTDWYKVINYYNFLLENKNILQVNKYKYLNYFALFF